MSVEHNIVCIDCFYVLICSTGDVLCFCVLVCVNFGDEILVRGKECKTHEKLEIFKKNGKMIIIIINCHNGSKKPRKFSRSRMTKQTTPLNSSRKI